nr:putative SMR (Small MutS Related) domain-containing protein [Tanacetum cinerariifolium]
MSLSQQKPLLSTTSFLPDQGDGEGGNIGKGKSEGKGGSEGKGKGKGTGESEGKGGSEGKGKEKGEGALTLTLSSSSTAGGGKGPLQNLSEVLILRFALYAYMRLTEGETTVLKVAIKAMKIVQTEGRDAGLTLSGVDVDEYQVGYDSALATTAVYESMFAAEDGTIPATFQAPYLGWAIQMVVHLCWMYLLSSSLYCFLISGMSQNNELSWEDLERSVGQTIIFAAMADVSGSLQMEKKKDTPHVPVSGSVDISIMRSSSSEALVINKSPLLQTLGKLKTDGVESFEEDGCDATLEIRLVKLGLVAAFVASRHSKSTTKAYLRRDHVAAHEFCQKARQKWSNDEKLHTNASKEILAIKNCENDDWTLDMHGLHATVHVFSLYAILAMNNE